LLMKDKKGKISFLSGMFLGFSSILRFISMFTYFLISKEISHKKLTFIFSKSLESSFESCDFIICLT